VNIRTRSIVTLAKRVKIILRENARVRENEKRTSVRAFTLSTNFFVKEKEKKRRREKNGFKI